jgi:hypothetical protein
MGRLFDIVNNTPTTRATCRRAGASWLHPEPTFAGLTPPSFPKGARGKNRSNPILQFPDNIIPC